MQLLLSCESISKSFGPRALFKEISIGFFDEDRIGLIGPNGAGKSTFLKILAGLEPPDTGELVSRRQLRLAYLPQEDIFPDGATAESVLGEALSDQHLEEHERLAQARIMLGKVGFARTEQPAAEMSGGWRKRLAVARELIRKPDLMLLDEPTNHLDLEGIDWLEKLLTSASFAFMLVSHDRYFLENVTNRTVELNPIYREGYYSVNGAYSDFLAKREELLSGQATQQQALAGRVRREVEWLKRGAKARTTKAKGRIQEAGRLMEELADLQTRNAQNRSLQIDFAATGRQTRKLLAAKAVAKTLGGRKLFSDLSLILSPGMKLGVLGPNGSGKSTLLRVLAGEFEPDAGQVQHADGLRIVLFDQARQQLDRSATLRAALCPTGDQVTWRDKPVHVSGWARRFLFRPEQLDMPVADLSGGEQARVLIARLMLRPADLLILDEPTNDLDIPSLEVLEESLEEFPGAVVLVTHDRYMLDQLCTDLVGLDGQGGASLYGDYLQWQRAYAAAKEAAAPRPATAKPAPRKPSAPAKRLTWNEQREWEQIEEKIMAAEAQVQAAHQAMEDPAVLADHQRLAEVCARMHEAQELVQRLYARWEELETKREK